MRTIYLMSIFLGSFLLFMIQPMLAKALLPLVGGAPAVWIVTMLFFQLLLLAGYGYAALGSAFMRPPVQLWVHVGLCLLAVALILPIQLTMPMEFNPRQPEIWVLATLLITIGMPYFLLSSNATLIQRWYHYRYRHSPYFLFSISNAGSLLGLLGYPFAVEWLLPIPRQMHWWGIGFTILLAALVVLAIWTMRTPAEHHAKETLGKWMPMKKAAFVVLMGFIPSSLFLSTTLYITTDIASFPLLWVIPLALYLLSFIIVFSPRGERFIPFSQKSHLFAAVILVSMIALPGHSLIWLLIQMLALFTAFFIIAVSCHGRAALSKPDPSQLTAFYFWLSFGGALGGLFNTLAPHLFDTVLEYYIVALLSVVAIPMSQLQSRAITIPVLNIKFSKRETAGLIAIFLLAITGSVLYLANQPDALLRGRSFFGVSIVYEDKKDDKIVYRHGTTTHGFQPTLPEHRLTVTSYYSPIESLLDTLPDSFFERPIGVLGLGAGVIACYGREGQAMTFYEIDQLVIDVASNPDLFTYLRDCPPDITTVLGDGRLQLERQKEEHYNLLVLDAFTSDAVPMHLLTREALDTYVNKVAPKTGVIAYNISNRFLDLEPLIARLAAEHDWYAYHKFHVNDENNPYDLSSAWMVLVPADSPWHDQLSQVGFEQAIPSDDAPLWTDDFSNLLSVLKTP